MNRIALRRRRRVVRAVALIAAFVTCSPSLRAMAAETSTTCDFTVESVDGGVEGVLSVVMPSPEPVPVRLAVLDDGTVAVTEGITQIACSGEAAPRAARTQRIRVTGTDGADDLEIDRSGAVGFPARMLFEVDLSVAEDPVSGPIDTVRVVGGAGADRFALVEPSLTEAWMVALSSGPVLSRFEGVNAWVVSTGDGDDVVDAGAYVGSALQVSLGAGDDRFIASVGDDVADAGTGRDEVSYEATPASVDGQGVLVLLALQGAPGIGQDTGASGSDVLAGFEAVVGSGFDDQLVGDDGANALSGGAGDDRLDGGDGDDVVAGGAGDDIVRGGDGTDRASYRKAPDGVTVDLALTAPQITGQGKDTLIEVEGLDGSDHDDVLRGTLGPDLLYGYKGDDRLVGLGGGDNLDGGEGRDVADYSWSLLPVTITLSSDPSAYGRAIVRGLDYLWVVEDVFGGTAADSITGSAGPNRLRGGAGDDTLRGLAGDDVLVGGPGRDLLAGGRGNDRCAPGSGPTGRQAGCER